MFIILLEFTQIVKWFGFRHTKIWREGTEILNDRDVESRGKEGTTKTLRHKDLFHHLCVFRVSAVTLLMRRGETRPLLLGNLRSLKQTA